MSEPMKCDLCEKQATVHLTQIVNNKIQKVDLCEGCAQNKGVTDPEGFALADLLAGAAKKSESTAQDVIECSNCGFTQQNLNKLGRLGCPSCYEVFHPIVEPMLETMHKGTSHCGKSPKNFKITIDSSKQIEELEEKMKVAIETEDFENAAVYRDELNKLKETV